MRRAIARLGGHDHVLVDGLRIARLRGAGRVVHGDRRRRRPRLLDRLRLGGREDRPRPDDAPPGACAIRSTAGSATAGYATREHRDAIRAHGLTPHHRSSWQALQVLLAGDQLGMFDDDGADGDGPTMFDGLPVDRQPTRSTVLGADVVRRRRGRRCGRMRSGRRRDPHG